MKHSKHIYLPAHQLSGNPATRTPSGAGSFRKASTSVSAESKRALKASASPTQKLCSPLLTRRCFRTRSASGLSRNTRPGKPTSAAIELQATVLVCAAQILVTLLVDFHLHEAIFETIEHVGTLERAAAGHRAVPHKLRGALPQPREASLKLGEQEVLLADLELCAVGELSSEAAPAPRLAFRVSVWGIGCLVERCAGPGGTARATSMSRAQTPCLHLFLTVVGGTVILLTMSQLTAVRTASWRFAVVLFELLTGAVWGRVQTSRGSASVLMAPSAPPGFPGAGPLRRGLATKVFRHGSHISSGVHELLAGVNASIRKANASPEAGLLRLLPGPGHQPKRGHDAGEKHGGAEELSEGHRARAFSGWHFF